MIIQVIVPTDKPRLNYAFGIEDGMTTEELKEQVDKACSHANGRISMYLVHEESIT